MVAGVAAPLEPGSPLLYSDAVPIYEYKCKKGHTFEVVQRMADDSLDKCTKCGAEVKRVFHPPAVHFKGSGFYTTDYGRGSSNGNDSGSKDEGKKDAKTETKSSDSSSKSDSGNSSSSSKSDSGSGKGSSDKSKSAAAGKT